MVMRKTTKAVVLLGGLWIVPAESYAGAFMLQEQSVKGSGRAYAGDNAAAEDASTIFSNPAGMTELKKSEALIGAYAMFPRAEISNTGTNIGGTPIPGNNDQGFDPGAFGHLYVATPIASGLWGGVGITAPFGLANKYDSTFFGRYDSTQASVRAIDIAPTLAYRIHPQISIGGGVDFQYFDAKLVNAVPTFGTPATDGQFKVDGSDWSIGYNLGVLFKPVDNVKVGVTYRSAITQKVEGDATTTLFGSTTSQGFTSEIDLPDTIGVGVSYDVTPSLTLLSQVNRFGWSRFKEIRLKFDDGTETATTENYRDTWGVSIGAEYKVAPGWTVRGGMLYDQTPTRDAYRSVIVPDVNRFWASVGASYQMSETFAFDVSYEHLFENDAVINRTNAFPGGLPTVQTQGRTETSSDVLGVSLRMQF